MTLFNHIHSTNRRSKKLANWFGLSLLVSATALLPACSDSKSGDDGDENTNKAQPGFNLKTGISPLPIDLFYAGSTDGTLNIPNAGGNPAIASVNALDGWSTSANLAIPMTEDIDESTLNGDTVRLLKVTTAMVAPGAVAMIPPPNGMNPPPHGMIPQPLIYGTDYFAEVSNAEQDGVAKSTLLIHPLKPFDAKSGYLVILASGIRATDGRLFEAPAGFQLIKDNLDPENPGADRFYRLPGDPDATGNPNQDITQLAIENDQTPSDAVTFEGIRRLYAGILGFTDAVQIPRSAITLAYTFSTQSINDSLQAAETQADNDAQKFAFVSPAPNGAGGTLNTSNVIAALPGIANIHAGFLNLRYYLEPATGPQDPTPLTTNWVADVTQHSNAGICAALEPSTNLTRCNSNPAMQTLQTAPLLVTVPNAQSGQSEPATGWPVVIFQHGITGDRSQMLPIADAMAQAGFVVMAIDQPLHGVDSTNPLYNMNIPERTFELDLVNNTTGESGPDGVADSSGAYYIQLANPITSRDNLRQSAIDILHLAKTIKAGIDLDPSDGDGNDLNPDQIYFIGHSLGGIVGGTALGVDTRANSSDDITNQDIKAAVIAMGGSGIAKLLDGSQSFGPVVQSGLAAQGVAEGTETFESFLRLAQTAADAGDPINYAVTANAQHPVLIYQVAGDAVVPNNVINNIEAIVDGYLSGTEPLAAIMQLPTVTAESFNASGNDGFQIFTAGDHGSIIDPTESLETTTRMQCEAATFFGSMGTLIAADSCTP